MKDQELQCTVHVSFCCTVAAYLAQSYLVDKVLIYLIWKISFSTNYFKHSKMLNSFFSTCDYHCADKDRMKEKLSN